MGLDITAYSQLEAVGVHVPSGEWCEDDNHVGAYAYDSFPQSFRGLPVLGTKDYPGAKFLEGGCYAVTPDTEYHGFSAGGYGGYNAWREDLQKQFNPTREAEAPFYELIWFADNEGSIGPDAARDLLADFREHADRYVPQWSWAEAKYQDWTRAFELAADGGLVRFH